MTSRGLHAMILTLAVLSAQLPGFQERGPEMCGPMLPPEHCFFIPPQRFQNPASGRKAERLLAEKKGTFSLSDRTALPLVDLTPEMHSNIMLDLWETPKSFGIDPVVASGGRFEGYYPHSVTYNHTALYWDTQQ